MIVAADGTQRLPQYHSDHVHEDGDPHIWHSTENAKIMVDNITRGIAEFDPDNRAFYEANAAAYKERLDEVAQEVTAILSVVPPERRRFVTSHEAFGYFAQQFNLEVVTTISVQSQSEEPDRQHIENVVARVRELGAVAIFTETSINPRLAEQIAFETGIKLVSDLYSDSLGPAGSGAENYIDMMLHNAHTIAAGLQ
jgi:ABC-type Zn uptake system ZnuABC Zn-binding protein ZnuA